MPVRFDGTTTDFLTLTATGAPSTTAFTQIFWMQVVNANAGANRYFSDMFDTGAVNRVSLWRPSDNNDELVSNASLVDLSANEDESSWQMWALTCSGTGAADLIARRWKAGDPDGTYASVTATGRSFTVAEWYLSGSYFATGRDARICFVKVWDAALSLAELQAERARGVPVRSSNVNRYHRLETGTDTTDYSGNGRACTINSGTTEGTEPVPWDFTEGDIVYRPRRTIFVPRITLG